LQVGRFNKLWVSRMLTRFLKNARGGVAPLMAIVAVPIMGAVGMAVDYTRVNAARTAFQVALDSTALMMAKTAATQTDEQRQTTATNTFSALFNRPEVTDATVTPVFISAGGSKLTLNGSAVVHTPGRHRYQRGQHQCDVGLDLGQYAPSGCAGAR
jgi:Flp pilus assembly protein TadG